jgi:tRNA(fMet)-specific endonuclease VapC
LGARLIVSSSTLYLLDTNITGYILRGRSPQARHKLEENLRNGSVAISCVTEAEILFGLELKPEARRLRTAIEQFFQVIEVVAWDREAAQAYARLRGKLQKAGKTLSEADLMIAAHAISMGAVLVSHDNAFKHVHPFVTVVDWAKDVK